MHYIYSKSQIDYYHSQANAIDPSRKAEVLGVLYYDYPPNNTISKNNENKIIFETSFKPYKGMKIYI